MMYGFGDATTSAHTRTEPSARVSRSFGQRSSCGLSRPRRRFEKASSWSRRSSRSTSPPSVATRPRTGVFSFFLFYRDLVRDSLPTRVARPGKRPRVTPNAHPAVGSAVGARRAGALSWRALGTRGPEHCGPEYCGPERADRNARVSRGRFKLWTQSSERLVRVAPPRDGVSTTPATHRAFSARRLGVVAVRASAASLPRTPLRTQDDVCNSVVSGPIRTIDR